MLFEKNRKRNEDQVPFFFRKYFLIDLNNVNFKSSCTCGSQGYEECVLFINESNANIFQVK